MGENQRIGNSKYRQVTASRQSMVSENAMLLKRSVRHRVMTYFFINLTLPYARDG